MSCSQFLGLRSLRVFSDSLLSLIFWLRGAWGCRWKLQWLESTLAFLTPTFQFWRYLSNGHLWFSEGKDLDASAKLSNFIVVMSSGYWPLVEYGKMVETRLNSVPWWYYHTLRSILMCLWEVRHCNMRPLHVHGSWFQSGWLLQTLKNVQR